METLQVIKSNALTAYTQADKSGKELLSNLFGKKVFQLEITERIKTFEDACQELGIDSTSEYYNSGTPDEIAYKKLKVIVLALNEGWIPNWDNSDEKKWRPWFYMDSPGFRLSAAGYVSSNASVGSRLCFKSEKLCLYAANQFKDLYQDFFTK